MKWLVFVPTAEGHFLEYMEYISKVVLMKENDCFVFYVHPFFKGNPIVERIGKYKNIRCVFFNLEQITFSKSYLKSAFIRYKLLMHCIKKEKVDAIFLIMIMPFSPFIFFPIWRKVKIYGIIYDIYLYRWKRNHLIKKIYDVFRFCRIKYSSNFGKIFILNDFTAADIYNRIYHTDKFVGLQDPYRPISTISKDFCLREKYKRKIIVSHIGGLKKRKGTYDILEAINTLSKMDADKYVFIFAGKAESPDYLRNEINRLNNNATILYFEGFVSFENIAEIVSSSDLLLLPYHNTNQSSGIIGYAAQFKVPVAVPGKEMLGKIVKRNKLGYLLDGYKSSDIKTFLEHFNGNYIDNSCREKMNNYLVKNNIDNFIGTIYSNL